MTESVEHYLILNLNFAIHYFVKLILWTIYPKFSSSDTNLEVSILTQGFSGLSKEIIVSHD